MSSCSSFSLWSVPCSNPSLIFHNPFSFNRCLSCITSLVLTFCFSFSPPFLCSVFCSLAVSPELPPRYLLGQAQRPNTITHVCWYRNQSLSLSDYLCMIQVKCLSSSVLVGRSHEMPRKMYCCSVCNCSVSPHVLV